MKNDKLIMKMKTGLHFALRTSQWAQEPHSAVSPLEPFIQTLHTQPTTEPEDCPNPQQVINPTD